LSVVKRGKLMGEISVYVQSLRTRREKKGGEGKGKVFPGWRGEGGGTKDVALWGEAFHVSFISDQGEEKKEGARRIGGLPHYSGQEKRGRKEGERKNAFKNVGNGWEGTFFSLCIKKGG